MRVMSQAQARPTRRPKVAEENPRMVRFFRRISTRTRESPKAVPEMAPSQAGPSNPKEMAMPRRQEAATKMARAMRTERGAVIKFV